MITNLCFEVEQPVELIFEYLSDMQKFAATHPVISKIEPLGNNKFLAHETLKLGFFPFSFTYIVVPEIEAASKTVIMRARIFGLTRIECIFKVKASGNASLVEETICFKTPLPIKLMMRRIFKEQHTLLFKNLGQLPAAQVV